MANSKRRCTNCKKYRPPQEGIICNIGFFCCDECRREYAINKTQKVIDKNKKQISKVERKETRQRKKELMTRSQWYAKLQKLVNQYVTKVRDVGKPCCTCGTTNPNIKYDAGHCFTRKARPDIMFNLKNIHIQCSVNCNQYGSGMRAEYKAFIATTYGDHVLDKLELKNPDLKDQFPNWQDIESEIARYRIILRNNNITPIV